ncbi:hypothetical protein [Campylobacter hyointestinalis]|uniref:hypothetical protein n=1 Tax=Campylobacter hyointestinalis TaxID=198 RepID=UPI0015EC2958|nr:hypothetical protein [Campylobacter hyointestinalis]
MKNIVLLGGSNSVMVNGLQKGLKEYANVTNLALGATTSIQNLYELYRPRNQEAIQSADLIVTESNINELDHHLDSNCKLPLDIIFKNMQYLYMSLYNIKKPVCTLILPRFVQNYRIIHNMHRLLANYFGFNIIDMSSNYEQENIIEFGKRFGGHQLSIINRSLGKNIAKNIDNFNISNKNYTINLPEFKVLTPEKMIKNGSFNVFNPKNSVFNEIVYRLNKDNYLSFKGYKDYRLLAIHGWNLESDGSVTKMPWDIARTHYSSICFSCNNVKVIKPLSKVCQLCEIQTDIIIEDNAKIGINKENLANTELVQGVYNSHPNAISLPYFDIIAFLLCKPNPKMKLFDLNVIPTDIDIEIDKDIDRSYLIPNIVFFKDSMEFIDEYIGHLYPNIVKHIDSVLTPQIIKKTEAQILSQLNKNTPQIQPSMQLSLEAENKILKDKIKELETNYQKAIKVKNHLSYKLGQALIKADKNWYKGGYIKFIFEAMKIKKEHKNKDKSNI